MDRLLVFATHTDVLLNSLTDEIFSARTSRGFAPQQKRYSGQAKFASKDPYAGEPMFVKVSIFFGGYLWKSFARAGPLSDFKELEPDPIARSAIYLTRFILLVSPARPIGVWKAE